MTVRFRDKVVLITGAGSGIGRATAVAFAREGAHVMLAGRTAEALDHTAALIAATGGIADTCPTDIRHAEHLARLLTATIGTFGQLDIAVNNAGIPKVGLVSDLTEADWRALLDTNLTGTWLSMKHEIAHLRQHGGGVIINIASNVGAHHSMPIIGAYGATKAAIAALTRAAAIAHISDGIRINAVSPGPVATSFSRAPGQSDTERDQMYATMIPRGRIGSPEEIADTVLWIASNEATYLVGHDIVADGGVSA